MYLKAGGGILALLVAAFILSGLLGWASTWGLLLLTWAWAIAWIGVGVVLALIAALLRFANRTANPF